MRFIETSLPGAYRIELEPHADERGFFARSFCQREFEAHGLRTQWVQCNVSFNHKKGTLRGMHYQRSPCEEAKLVRCTAGSLYDVIVDLREGSKSFGRVESFVLSAANRSMVYVPEGFAHGFQSLEDATEIFYQMSAFYAPDAGGGFRYDDPRFSIEWPEAVSVISPRDQELPFYESTKHGD